MQVMRPSLVIEFTRTICRSGVLKSRMTPPRGATKPCGWFEASRYTPTTSPLSFNPNRLREPSAVRAEVLEPTRFRPAKRVDCPVGQVPVTSDLAVAVDRESNEMRPAERAKLLHAVRAWRLREG